MGARHAAGVQKRLSRLHVGYQIGCRMWCRTCPSRKRHRKATLCLPAAMDASSSLDSPGRSPWRSGSSSSNTGSSDARKQQRHRTTSTWWVYFGVAGVRATYQHARHRQNNSRSPRMMQQQQVLAVLAPVVLIRGCAAHYAERLRFSCAPHLGCRQQQQPTHVLGLLQAVVSQAQLPAAQRQLACSVGDCWGLKSRSLVMNRHSRQCSMLVTPASAMIVVGCVTDRSRFVVVRCEHTSAVLKAEEGSSSKAVCNQQPPYGSTV